MYFLGLSFEKYIFFAPNETMIRELKQFIDVPNSWIDRFLSQPVLEDRS